MSQSEETFLRYYTGRHSIMASVLRYTMVRGWEAMRKATRLDEIGRSRDRRGGDDEHSLTNCSVFGPFHTSLQASQQSGYPEKVERGQGVAGSNWWGRRRSSRGDPSLTSPPCWNQRSIHRKASGGVAAVVHGLLGGKESLTWRTSCYGRAFRSPAASLLLPCVLRLPTSAFGSLTSW